MATLSPNPLPFTVHLRVAMSSDEPPRSVRQRATSWACCEDRDASIHRVQLICPGESKWADHSAARCRCSRRVRMDECDRIARSPGWTSLRRSRAFPGLACCSHHRRASGRGSLPQHPFQVCSGRIRPCCSASAPRAQRGEQPRPLQPSTARRSNHPGRGHPRFDPLPGRDRRDLNTTHSHMGIGAARRLFHVLVRRRSLERAYARGYLSGPVLGAPGVRDLLPTCGSRSPGGSPKEAFAHAPAVPAGPPESSGGGAQEASSGGRCGRRRGCGQVPSRPGRSPRGRGRLPGSSSFPPPARASRGRAVHPPSGQRIKPEDILVGIEFAGVYGLHLRPLPQRPRLSGGQRPARAHEGVEAGRARQQLKTDQRTRSRSPTSSPRATSSASPSCAPPTPIPLPGERPGAPQPPAPGPR